MKTVRVTCTWHTHHEFEVDDDWRVPGTLDGFTEEQLDEMRADDPSAELVDWG